MSGIQKQVLSLYRRCLRAAMSKPKGIRESQIAYVKSQFRTGAKSVKKSEFKTIETMLRLGEKQLKTLGKKTVGTISTHEL